MHSIWAVAVNTIKQVLRMRIAVVFTVLLAVLLPLLGFSTTGDGTLKGRLQTFVSYGLSLTSLLLCLMTIIISCYSLTYDLRQKLIYTVITKPIHRYQLLLGKLLGIILLNFSLLVLFTAVIYTIAIYSPRFSEVSEQELDRAEKEFFTARAGLKPNEADVTREVERIYQEQEKSGRLEELLKGAPKKKIITEITKRKQLEKRAVPVGRELVWEFENVRVHDPNQSIFIRFKYDVSVNPPDLQVYGYWRVGDIRQIRYGTRPETPVRDFRSKDLIRTFHEIEVPADVVAKDGYLAVAFWNVPLNETVVIFPLDEGLEILYKAGTFTANYIKAVLLILLRLVFLAVMGVLASTFLSFPVAILFSLVIFLTANFSGFLVESFELLSENMSEVYSYTFRPMLRLLPQFDQFNPTRYLVSARFLSWPLVVEAAGLMICVKALLLLLLALLIFRYKEIARISV